MPEKFPGAYRQTAASTAEVMSQTRSQPWTGAASRRRTSSASVDRRPPIPTPPPPHGPPADSYKRRVASAPTNYRDRPKAPSRPQSYERLTPARKTAANLLGRTEHSPAPTKQLARHGSTGNWKSHGNQNKRPPFVVGTGNSTTCRGGGGGGHGYATTKTEARSRSSAILSRDRHSIVGSVAKDSGIDSKMKRSEKPVAAHATETMTLIPSNAPRHSPDVTESSATVIVADPLPEVFLHRTNRRQHHPSADECIKKVAEKLSEFAATQNNAGDVAKSETVTILNRGGHRPITGNDVITDSRRCDVTGSPRPPQDSQEAASTGGNDVSSASKRVSGTLNKAAEVHRNGPTRLTTACRPSPTRSSLLRQAHNCPISAASQQRVPRPQKPTVSGSYRPATELVAENHLQTSLRQPSITKQGRVSCDQTANDVAAQPRK